MIRVCVGEKLTLKEVREKIQVVSDNGGWLHFPDFVELCQTHFMELSSESNVAEYNKLVKKNNKGAAARRRAGGGGRKRRTRLVTHSA